MISGYDELMEQVKNLEGYHCYQSERAKVLKKGE